MGNALIAIVADSGPAAGLGHLARCSAIAVALTERGRPPVALAWGAPGTQEIDGVSWQALAEPEGLPPEARGEVVLIDSYRSERDALVARADPRRLAAMHDHGSPPAGADLLVSIAAPNGSSRARVLAGLEYACLRRAFWDPPAREPRGVVERVLVASGGGDPGGEAARAAEALAQRLSGVEVVLVRGPYAAGEPPPGVTAISAPGSLREELERADLAITAAGQTMLEALAVGTPCIACVLVPNQRPGGRLVAAERLAVVLDGTGPEDVADAAARLAADADARREMSARAQRRVDGRGAQRVAEAIAELADA